MPNRGLADADCIAYSRTRCSRKWHSGKTSGDDKIRVLSLPVSRQPADRSAALDDRTLSFRGNRSARSIWEPPDCMRDCHRSPRGDSGIKATRREEGSAYNAYSRSKGIVEREREREIIDLTGPRVNLSRASRRHPLNNLLDSRSILRKLTSPEVILQSCGCEFLGVEWTRSIRSEFLLRPDGSSLAATAGAIL